MNVLSVMQTRPARFGLFCTSVRVLILAAAMVLVSACAADAAKTVKAKAEISAVEELNPDYQGRPSPVKVIMFQLSAADAFDNADFFSLFDPESGVLGGDELARTEMLLQPGESREWEAEFDEATIVVGVVAAFRDIENAQWRASAALVEQGITGKILFKKKKLKVTVDSLAVSVTTE